MAKLWLSKSIFYIKNDPNLSNFFFIGKYNFMGHTFCYWHFLKTSLLKPRYIPKWRPIFDNFYSTECKTQKHFNRLVFGFGPKGKPGRMWDIVRLKWGHTKELTVLMYTVVMSNDETTGIIRTESLITHTSRL